MYVYKTCLQEPVSKMQRKPLSTSKSSGSKIQTGTGNHQLQKKNSASALIEKQVNEARLKAEQEAEEKMRRETEKILEEKNKVREFKSYVPAVHHLHDCSRSVMVLVLDWWQNQHSYIVLHRNETRMVWAVPKWHKADCTNSLKINTSYNFIVSSGHIALISLLCMWFRSSWAS